MRWWIPVWTGQRLFLCPNRASSLLLWSGLLRAEKQITTRKGRDFQYRIWPFITSHGCQRVPSSLSTGELVDIACPLLLFVQSFCVSALSFPSPFFFSVLPPISLAVAWIIGARKEMPSQIAPPKSLMFLFQAHNYCHRQNTVLLPAYQVSCGCSAQLHVIASCFNFPCWFGKLRWDAALSHAWGVWLAGRVLIMFLRVAKHRVLPDCPIGCCCTRTPKGEEIIARVGLPTSVVRMARNSQALDFVMLCPNLPSGGWRSVLPSCWDNWANS